MTHWKTLTNPNYIGSYAFQPNEEKIGTIKAVNQEVVTDTNGKESLCIVAHFEESDLKPLVMNKTNCKTMSKLYSPYLEEWPGKGIIMAVQKVNAFGEITDAIRIRPVKPLYCEECGKPIKPYARKNAAELAKYTKEKYNRQLCSICANKAKGEMKNAVSE